MELTYAQRVELARMIDRRVDELEQRIRETLPKPADEATLERTGLAQDEVDDATTSAQEHFNHSMHRHYVDELRQIEAARARVTSGMADCCVDCDEPIGYERLRAQPHAVRCVDCQARHEYASNLLQQLKP